MGRRLTGFDYSRPYFYMVTMKCLEGAQALSEIVAPGKCRLNAITRAFVNVIRHFHEACPAIAQIGTFTIMPDHIHLIIKIVSSSTNRPLRLEAIVELLMQALEGAYREVTGRREQVFDARWHDWIVLERGHLAAFTRYIHENPLRAFLRQSNREFFRRVSQLSFAGREWHAYGNPALLGLPVIEPFRCSRKWAKDGPEWRGAVARAGRIGPGGAGAGTFMSPCEKECGNEIFKAGGALIVLSPEGFAPRWHPARNKEALCAKGRMLYLSLYEPSAAKPDNATLYQRCHEMGDAIVAGLSGGTNSGRGGGSSGTNSGRGAGSGGTNSGGGSSGTNSGGGAISTAPKKGGFS